MSSNMENVLPVYGFAVKPEGGGGLVTPEQIQQAVDNYLEENPVQPGATVEQAAQIEKNKTDISELSEEYYEQKNIYDNILQIKQTANLLNPDKLEPGKVFDSDGSVIDGSAKRSMSKKIYVNQGSPLRVTTNYNQSLCQYNDSDVLISKTDTFSSATPIEISKNTKYIRICVWNSKLPFMLYQNDDVMQYEKFGYFSENTRKIINIYTSDTEEEIFLKMKDAYDSRNCDVVFESGIYEFDSIFELMKTKYRKNTAYELPIGGKCRYYFNGATLKGTYTGDDENVYGNTSILGSWRESTGGFELYDGILIATNVIYCVHDETSSSSIPYINKYKNMRMYYISGEKTKYLSKCIGGGTGLYPMIEISDCYFDSDNGKDIGWHGHNREDSTVFYINVNGCYLENGFSADFLGTNEAAQLVFNGNSTKEIPSNDGKWNIKSWNNNVHE